MNFETESGKLRIEIIFWISLHCSCESVGSVECRAMANCECDQKLESMLTSTFDLIGPADYYDQRHQIKKKTPYISLF